MTYSSESPDLDREFTPTIRFSTSDLYIIGGFTDVCQCKDAECHRFIRWAIETALREQDAWHTKRKETST